MREESFSEDSKFWVDPPSQDIVSAGTMLYVQVSAQNVEQAKKGKLKPEGFDFYKVNKVGILGAGMMGAGIE